MRELGHVINLAVGDPKKLEEIRPLLEGERRGGPAYRWWDGDPQPE